MYSEGGLWERSYPSIFSHYHPSPPPPGGLGQRAGHAQRPGARAFEDPSVNAGAVAGGNLCSLVIG